MVRLGTVFCIALLAAPGPASSADVRNEDLRLIGAAFKRADPTLNWFEAREKKPVDATRSVMIVEAAPTDLRPAGPQGQLKRLPVPGKNETGVFLVAGPLNDVQLVLDVLAVGDINGYPKIEDPGPKSVNLHFYSDYGIYGGSIKYFFDLSRMKSLAKMRYAMLALTASEVRNGTLVYTADSSGPIERHELITIHPRSGNELPAYKITDAATAAGTIPEPLSMRLPESRTAVIWNTLPGQEHQTAGIALVEKSGARAFYPVPVPTMDLNRRLRPNEQPPAEIENNIGPAALDGSVIWFANSFYDGEGTSGVGAIGSFDVHTHKFEMRYLREIAPWSGSASRIDGDDLWIGLMRRPEGAAFSGGLLRFNRRTGAVAKFDIPDYIHTIDRLGDAIYCGTSNGLYRLRGGEITQMRFEPDARGKLTMFTRTFFPGHKTR
jgi:hypothetical protein